MNKVLFILSTLSFLFIYDTLTKYEHKDIKSKVFKLTHPTGTCTAFSLEHNNRLYTITAAHCVEMNIYGVYALFDESNKIHFANKVKEDSLTDTLVLTPIIDSGLKLADQISLRLYDYGFVEQLKVETGIYMYEKEIEVLVDEYLCYTGQKKYYLRNGLFRNLCVQKTNEAVTTIPVYPGNSGGPVVDHDGKVVGIANIGEENKKYGYLVTLRELKDLMDSL